MLRILRAALVTLVLLPALAAPGPAVASLPSCRVHGIAYEVRCGALERPLDPARPQGPRITVHYVVVPAVARNPAPDPVFLLAGGPGQSAIDVAGDVLGLLSRLHNRHDLVFVDQRGTGRSAPLACDDPAAKSLQAATDPDAGVRVMQSCRDQLLKLPYIGAAADLGLFTTPLAMQDLDAVREALGANAVNLIGASYGTRAVLDYQRQFPARVRRSVLDGVAPPDMVLPVSASADNQAALYALWSACAAEPACHAAFPHLTADWTALKASLPRDVTVRDPRSGLPTRVHLTLAVLMGAVRGPLYSPVVASALPQAISAAAQGSFEALLTLGGLVAPHGDAQIAAGMHFSVICAEDAPRMAQTPAGTGADFDDLFADLYRKVCAQWPRGTVPAAFYTVPPARTPVLLLSGGLDPMTPPRHAARVARLLGPLARAVTVPNAGHGVMGQNCMADVIFHFITAPDAAAALAVDAGCALDIPRPLAFVLPPAAKP
jgi:pimeloyl-ACP methyl ester carboxylesterase